MSQTCVPPRSRRRRCGYDVCPPVASTPRLRRPRSDVRAVRDVVRAEPLVVVEAVADAVDVSVVSNSAGCSRGAAQCDWMPGAARRAQHAALDRAHVAAYHVSAAPTIGNGKQRAAENPKRHHHQLPRRRRREEDGLAETALGVAALARPLPRHRVNKTLCLGQPNLRRRALTSFVRGASQGCPLRCPTG